MNDRGLKRWVPFVALALLGLGAAEVGQRSPAGDMAVAAQRFAGTLSPELRARAQLKFDDPARLDWHFVPRTRPGVTFGEMNDAQRAAARDLLRSALSSHGLLKAEAIMALDNVLRDMDKASGGTGAGRDPLAYTMTIYGSPDAGTPWGWKIEGHHLSLNFTMPKGDAAAVTPSFFGANPAMVKSGPHAGERVLAAEEDLGRELARSFDAEQRKMVMLPGDVPRDILTMPGRKLDEAPAAGLAHADMTPAQRGLLERLIGEYAHSLRHELAEQELDRIRSADMGKVRFAWAGTLDVGRPHYYRITGPTFVIEYDNTQNDANHVHTVWHDRERDFGHDLLKEHYDHKHE